MTPFEIVLVVYAAVLAAAALGVVYRMIVGPTILDRALSSDSLVTLVVMGMALYAAQSRATWAGPVMLALTGLAFIGTVTFARFVAREDVRQGRPRHHPHEPSTETGPHEAIHPGPYGDGAGEEPVNRFSHTPQEHLASPEASAAGDPRDSGPDGDPGPDDIWTDEAYDDDDFVAGFGAEPGSRGFEDGAEPRPGEDKTGPRRPEEPTEGAR